MRLKNLAGQKFGRLTVLNYADNYKWNCLCDCGNKTVVSTSNLKLNKTKSCGCIQKKSISNIGKNNKKYNEYDLSGEYGIGYTSNTDSEGRNYFYFDLEDYDLIKDYCWSFGSADVVNSGSYGKHIMLHRLIMGVLDNNNVDVDHIKHNRYDNRKSQLRIVTNSQNQMNKGIRSNNTSGVTGVYWVKSRNEWLAIITKDNKTHNLGYYKNKEDAIKARKEAEEKYFGEYSYDNSMNME